MNIDKPDDKKTSSSIRRQISVTFAILFIAVFLVIAVAYTLLAHINAAYDASVSQITSSNHILQDLDVLLIAEADKLAFNRIGLEKSELRANQVKLRDDIMLLKSSANTAAGKRQLDIVLRTLDNVNRDSDILLGQVAANTIHDERVKLLINIRYAVDWISLTLNNYISTEIAYIEDINQSFQNGVQKALYIGIGTVLLLLVFIFSRYLAIRKAITKPITELMKKFKQVGKGNFALQSSSHIPNELRVLDYEFGEMTKELNHLMYLEKEKKEQLHSLEIRLLQEQINPHFLYNTLETIITEVELGHKASTVALVKTLSRFFRLSLSGGRDLVKIADEVDHVRQYLLIQRQRYRDILDFHIEEDVRVASQLIPKLSLQPIVENAIYHGIKATRKAGTIIIRTSYVSDEIIEISVLDNGVGMSETDLENLQKRLEKVSLYSSWNEHELDLTEEAEHIASKATNPSEVNTTNPSEANTTKPSEVNTTNPNEEKSYGLMNIERRIKLHCGEGYGLSIQSSFGKGSLVILRLKATLE